VNPNSSIGGRHRGANLFGELAGYVQELLGQKLPCASASPGNPGLFATGATGVEHAIDTPAIEIRL
jgi:hypothetical protein